MLDRAIECLDIRTHTGVHPRFGVVDILPIVPYEESRAIAERVAHDIGSRADATLPVHFYDDSRPLPELRRELRAPHQQHPTAGVLCIGVRPPLIAFNVNVRTQLDAAKQIARGLRSMPGIRALAFELPSRGLVQISMNLIAPDQTGPKTAYERVAASGVRIVDAEVVGLVPQTVAHELSDVPLRVPFRTIEEALNRT
jgi:glutamate formiminotransferase